MNIGKIKDVPWNDFVVVFHYCDNDFSVPARRVGEIMVKQIEELVKTYYSAKRWDKSYADVQIKNFNQMMTEETFTEQFKALMTAAYIEMRYNEVTTVFDHDINRYKTAEDLIRRATSLANYLTEPGPSYKRFYAGTFEAVNTKMKMRFGTTDDSKTFLGEWGDSEFLVIICKDGKIEYTIL